MKLASLTEARLSKQTIDLVGSFHGEGVNTIIADDINVRLNILNKSKYFNTKHSKQYEVEIVRIRNAPKIVAQYIKRHSGDEITYDVYDDGSWMITGASWSMVQSV